VGIAGIRGTDYETSIRLVAGLVVDWIVSIFGPGEIVITQHQNTITIVRGNKTAIIEVTRDAQGEPQLVATTQNVDPARVQAAQVKIDTANTELSNTFTGASTVRGGQSFTPTTEKVTRDLKDQISAQTERDPGVTEILGRPSSGGSSPSP
jgi:arginine/ornithine N-succinyltransferase beta subunit